MVYVGETGQELRVRVGQHLSSFKLGKLRTHVVNHFKGDCRIDNMQVKILEKMTDFPQKTPKELAIDRRQREDFWIRNLGAFYPLGLNEKVNKIGRVSRRARRPKGLVDLVINSDQDRNENPRRKGHRKNNGSAKRNKRLTNTSNSHTSFANLITLFVNQGPKGTIHKLKQISPGNIREWLRLSHTVPCPTRLKRILAAYVDNVYRSENPNPPTPAPPRQKFFMPFLNKAVEVFDPNFVLRHPKVRKNIPEHAKIREPPMVVFSYSKPICNSVCNYSRLLKDLSDQNIHEILDENCLCSQSPFIYQPVGHVVTGNLGIVDDQKLRSVLSKGAKFRETPSVNWDAIKTEFSKAVKSFVTRWARREKLPATEFLQFKCAILKVARKRLLRLSKRFTNNSNQLLNTEKCKAQLSEIYKRFVIVPADKASGNFVFVCKKYYILKISQELGLIPGNQNEAYKKCDFDPNVPIQQTTNFVKSVLGLETADDHMRLPHLFWLPKLHKNPYKERYIAGATKVTTTGLSKTLASAYKLIFENLKRYCNKVEESTGVRIFWPISCSTQALTATAEMATAPLSVDTYDFSTLYTKIPLDKIKCQIGKLIVRVFNHGANKGKDIYVRNDEAVFSKSPTPNAIKLELDTMIQATNFLVDNTYVVFGETVYRQIMGIPMGGNASPMLADLFLLSYEMNFMLNFRRENPTTYNAMCTVVRYLDDLMVVNFPEFDRLKARIYPEEMEISKTNENSTEAVYLDIRFSIENEQFVTSVYHKIDEFNFPVVSLPFLESNVNSHLCYTVVFGQLIRFARISSSWVHLRNRCNFLFQKLLTRNYSRTRLSGVFAKFVQKFPNFSDKFTHFTNERRIMHLFNECI